MRSIITILLLLFASVAHAQQDDRTGLTFGLQTGFEVIQYNETSNTSLSGNSSAIVGTLSIEYNLAPKFKLPIYVAISGGMPLIDFHGKEHGTKVEDGVTYITQKVDVVHEYTMGRAFLGVKVDPLFSPFVLFERALFNSTRSNMELGTDEGVFVPAQPQVSWQERVWSTHLGAGFQGGFSIAGEGEWAVKYRIAGMMPVSVFLTNDHPEIQQYATMEQQGQQLGQKTKGYSVLSRLALHYNWHPRSSFQLGANLYARKWNGDGQQVNGVYWPENVMYAVPVLLGFTWAI